MKKIYFTITLIALTIVFLYSCRKDHAETDIDKQLYTEILQPGYTYYQNGDVIAGAGASPHGSFKLRFNATADSALDSSGELPAGNTFPTGSVIVKEIISGGTISMYAVMKKDPTNLYENGGWLWAEYNTNGNATTSAIKAGSDCTGCHSDIPNRDLVRTFDLH